MSEFCPRCNAPLETAQDPARLCEVCGWFGDWQEVLSTPPKSDVFNPITAAAQALELFRDVCRKELIAEQVYDAGNATEADLRQVRVARRHATHALIEMFVALRAWTPKRRLERVNGLVPWPEDWPDRHFNASREPCDMLIGPCSCGAWHTETEEWVQETLRRHGTEISGEEA
jgi:hypothetical protein